MNEYLLGILATLITAAVIYIAGEVRSLRIALTRIRTELDTASPAEVLKAVNKTDNKIARIEVRLEQLESHH